MRGCVAQQQRISAPAVGGRNDCAHPSNEDRAGLLQQPACRPRRAAPPVPRDGTRNGSRRGEGRRISPVDEVPLPSKRVRLTESSPSCVDAIGKMPVAVNDTLPLKGRDDAERRFLRRLSRLQPPYCDVWTFARDLIVTVTVADPDHGLVLRTLRRLRRLRIRGRCVLADTGHALALQKVGGARRASSAAD
jgi:hypothetical protein